MERDIEAEALAAVRNEQLGVDADPSEIPKNDGPKGSFLLIALLVLGGVLVLVGLVSPCSIAKFRAAATTDGAHGMALLTSDCERREGTCHCSTRGGECESKVLCNFPVTGGEARCGMLHVDCFGF